MTVRELIKILKKENQDSDIDITTYDGGVYDSCLIIHDNEEDTISFFRK